MWKMVMSDGAVFFSPKMRIQNWETADLFMLYFKHLLFPGTVFSLDTTHSIACIISTWWVIYLSLHSQHHQKLQGTVNGSQKSLNTSNNLSFCNIFCVWEHPEQTYLFWLKETYKIAKLLWGLRRPSSLNKWKEKLEIFSSKGYMIRLTIRPYLHVQCVQLNAGYS